MSIIHESLNKNHSNKTMSCISSFVLLACDKNSISAIMDELQMISIVTKIKKVNPMYDLLVEMKSDSDTIKKTILNKIRSIEGVRSSLTLVGYDSAKSDWRR